MDVILFAVEPHDLDLLMLGVQSIEQLYSISSIRAKLNLGEMWRALHFLLTQQLHGKYDDSSFFAIEAEYKMAYTCISTVDVRYNAIEKTQSIAQTLNAISIQELQKQFNPDQLNHYRLFPFHWGHNIDKERDQLLGLFEQLNHFYQFAKVHHYTVVSLRIKQKMSLSHPSYLH